MKHFLMYFHSLKLVEEALSDETVIDAARNETWKDIKAFAMEPDFRKSK